jgi:uncharacterized protein (UPF0276 family)
VAAAGAEAVDAAGAEEDDMKRLNHPQLGLGIGWRPELALDIERRRDLGFVEIVAENIDPDAIPASLLKLREAGVQVIPHGISLSLGGAEPIDPARARRLADLARRLDSPLVSEHIAFVRAGEMEAGHLLPLPRTNAALRILIDNVKMARELLDVPLALENISALFEWPGGEMSDAEFVSRVVEETDTGLLLDVANVWANARNLDGNSIVFLRHLPLERVAYVHVAGGEERDGTYHDTHAAPVSRDILDLLAELCQMTSIPGVMLERDDHFPDSQQLNSELDAIASAFAQRQKRSVTAHA